jgi:hypothetical protein
MGTGRKECGEMFWEGEVGGGEMLGDGEGGGR